MNVGQPFPLVKVPMQCNAASSVFVATHRNSPLISSVDGDPIVNKGSLSRTRFETAIAEEILFLINASFILIYFDRRYALTYETYQCNPFHPGTCNNEQTMQSLPIKQIHPGQNHCAKLNAIAK